MNKSLFHRKYNIQNLQFTWKHFKINHSQSRTPPRPTAGTRANFNIMDEVSKFHYLIIFILKSLRTIIYLLIFSQFHILRVMFLSDVPVQVTGVTRSELTSRTLIGFISCMSHHVCLNHNNNDRIQLHRNCEQLHRYCTKISKRWKCLCVS